MSIWLFLGGLNGLLAVVAGAYGWHTLGGQEGPYTMFEIGARYQMSHALALLAVAWLASKRSGRAVIPIHIAGAAFTIGIVLFAGSLYAFAIAGALPVEGAAPAGGIALMIGWLALMWTAVQTVRRRP